jgi:DNA modification methylase
VAHIITGDCRDILPTLEAGSVHCVVTSPPYWGLRDYGTAEWEGGEDGCDHTRVDVDAWVKSRENRPNVTGAGIGKGGPTMRAQIAGIAAYRDQCGKCGARRIDCQLGLESTPDEYVADMVAVFREVRRVLRDDGTVWLNLGDSYAGGGGFFPDAPSGATSKSGRYGANGALIKGQIRATDGLKPKDLVGIPWRVAFALQADGWYLRSDIIWSKPNPMPESVTDRPTKSHEYVFLLSKRERYYFDADAVREDVGPNTIRRAGHVVGGGNGDASRNDGDLGSRLTFDQFIAAGRNIRSVWTIATQPYPGAHFATFPEALVVPCIKAGTSERGVCSECGASWERVVEASGGLIGQVGGWHPHDRTTSDPLVADKAGGHKEWADYRRTTTGWRPSCAHDAPTVPATVLDPFAGSGTVGRVAERLSRRAILIELSEDYVDLAQTRTAQMGLAL